MTKPYERTPRGYNGKKVTTHRVQDVLPYVLGKIAKQIEAKSALLLELWPKIIGPKLAPMTRAVRFCDKVLYVHVTNSTLLSLLHTPSDKERLLSDIRKQLPGVVIEDIVFRIG